MKQKSKAKSFDLVTDAEKRDLHDKPLRRNRMRKKARLPLLDTDAELAMEIARVGQDRFKAELAPYVRDACKRIPACGGFLAAMIRGRTVRCVAEARLRDEKVLVRGPRQNDRPALT